jgi:hypothetical protein
MGGKEKEGLKATMSRETTNEDGHEGEKPNVQGTPETHHQNAVSEHNLSTINSTTNTTSNPKPPPQSKEEEENDWSTEDSDPEPTLPILKPDTPPHTPPAKPSPLTDLPWPLRKQILSHALNIDCPNACTRLEFLSPLPAVLRTSRQLRSESRGLLSALPLQISTPWGPDVTLSVQWQKYAIHLIYGETVEELVLVADLVHEVSNTGTINSGDVVREILGKPGVHSGSQFLVPEIKDGKITELNVASTAVLARKIASYNSTNRKPTRINKDEDAEGGGNEMEGIHTTPLPILILPLNHSPLFTYPLYTPLTLTHLTLSIAPTFFSSSSSFPNCSWATHSFAPSVQHHRVLPLIALIAAIIAHRPIWLKTVTIEGLGVFEHMFKGMWEQIPDRTPVVGDIGCWMGWLSGLLLSLGMREGERVRKGERERERVAWRISRSCFLTGLGFVRGREKAICGA